MTEPEIDTHGKRVGFGKHRGELWTRVPVSYLRWVVNVQPLHRAHDIALSELHRRGTSPQDRAVDISGHAVDSASLRLWSYYKKTREDSNEGLHAWLIRMTTNALNTKEMDSENRITVDNVRYVFEPGTYYPALKTVMKRRKSK